MSIICIIIICLCVSNPAFAKVIVEDYELGIAGQWRQNRWIPLRFVVKSLNESFDGKIVAQVDQTSTVSMPLNLSYKDLEADTLYLFLNKIAPQISLSLIDTEDNLIDSKTFIPEPPKRLEDLVILVITPAKDELRHLEYQSVASSGPPRPPSGPTPDLPTRMGDGDMTTKKGRTHVIYADSFRNLPRQWIGYSSIDLVIIKDVPLDSIQIAQSQQKALVDWITAGGTLLIPGGRNYQYVKRGFIKPLLPVEFIELASSSELKILNEKFDFNFDLSYSFDLIKTRPKACGQLIFEDDGTPLIVERKFGDGRVLFMAFDYSVHPFSDEPGFSNFWSWFTNTLAKSEVRKEMVYEPHRKHERKIRDLLASNLSKKAPLIRFAGVFLILYIVSVCLGNLLLKRYTRNSKMIIFVNFAIILTFSAVLLLSQNFWENDILLRNLSIMKLYPETKRARLDSYIGIIGERSAAHTVEFDFPRLRSGEMVFLRGLPTTPNLEFIQASSFRLSNVHVAPWAMNAFHSQTFFDINGAKPSKSTIQIEQEDEKSFIISNNLPFALEDVCVIYQNRLGKVEEISEDSKVELELEEEFDDSIPPVFGRTLREVKRTAELRREFSKIIANEGILSYLNEVKSPILLGWVKSSFLKLRSKNYTFSGETLVILRRRIFCPYSKHTKNLEITKAKTTNGIGTK